MKRSIVREVNRPRKHIRQADVSSVSTSSERISPIRADQGLMLETSAFESLYVDLFTLSAQLIKANYLVILPTDAAPQFLPFVQSYSLLILSLSSTVTPLTWPCRRSKTNTHRDPQAPFPAFGATYTYFPGVLIGSLYWLELKLWFFNT